MSLFVVERAPSSLFIYFFVVIVADVIHKIRQSDAKHADNCTKSAKNVCKYIHILFLAQCQSDSISLINVNFTQKAAKQIAKSEFYSKGGNGIAEIFLIIRRIKMFECSKRLSIR